MTRVVVDVGVALTLAAGRIEVAPEHELLAPTLLRSQALSVLHEAVHRGELKAETAQERLRALQGIKIRLLGDAVLRKVAWEVADQLGWSSTFDAEYVALTKLQADALATQDRSFVKRIDGLVPTVGLEALTRADAAVM